MPIATCSECRTTFEPHFAYQVEADARGGATSYFCSQRCLEQRHVGDGREPVACDACGRSFRVTLAAHVLFTGGKRRYACSLDCRSRLTDAARAIRLGELKSLENRAIACSAATEPELGTGRLLPFRPPARTAPDGGARVVSVFNHKGGTGKTTTAVSVAAGLSARGQRVLLIDTDGQGNVGTSLGLRFSRSLYHVLVMGMAAEQAVVSARPNLDVLPADETLAAAELYLAGRRERDRVLLGRLAPCFERYDYVVIDCSPSLSLLNQNALCASMWLLCPVACDYLSLIGVRQVLRTLRQVNHHLSHGLELWGVLPTQFDARARICHESLSALRSHFGGRCLEPIRQASKAREAPAHGKTIFEYAPGTPVAADYARVVERLLETQPELSTLAQAEPGGVA
ncbi:MAG TPA: ParA family protein [Polyangiaceae bacterium]|jgi:chromosome partitioning protein